MCIRDRDIIYEDKDLIVINKPAGIVMHPGAGNFDNTIVNALMNYSKNSFSNIGGELRPGIVHRIDKNTSGLIVIAKNNQTHEHLSNQFNKHTIQKYAVSPYTLYAIVSGESPSGTSNKSYKDTLLAILLLTFTLRHISVTSFVLPFTPDKL